MLSSEIGRLRLIGIAEGISFLLLMGVAMPMKYLAGDPTAVKILGWLHGLLFILYCVALAQAAAKHMWRTLHSGLLFVAALVPAGPLFADRWLKRQQHSTNCCDP